MVGGNKAFVFFKTPPRPPPMSVLHRTIDRNRRHPQQQSHYVMLSNQDLHHHTSRLLATSPSYPEYDDNKKDKKNNKNNNHTIDGSDDYYDTLLSSSSYSRSSSTSTTTPPSSVAIVGGGLAGLATAHGLIEKALKACVPIHITVFDKTSQPGLGGASAVAGGYVCAKQKERLAFLFVCLSTVLLGCLHTHTHTHEGCCHCRGLYLPKYLLLRIETISLSHMTNTFEIFITKISETTNNNNIFMTQYPVTKNGGRGTNNPRDESFSI